MFFFQAEDGIRDLVRSRGLGDVYKRQMRNGYTVTQAELNDVALICPGRPWYAVLSPPESAVSYTHLTLPTSDLV